MADENKAKLIQEFKYAAAFQEDCLSRGDWDDFDKLEEQMEKLAQKIAEND